MSDRSVLVLNPTEQIRTNVDILRAGYADGEVDADLTLLTVFSGANEPETASYNVFPVPLLNYTLPGLTFFLQLARTLPEADVVVVAEYEYLSSVVGVVVAKAFSKPVILTTDAVLGVNWQFGNPLVDAFLLVYTYTIGFLVCNLSDELVVFCESHESDIRRIALHEDVRVIPNGVDINRFSRTTLPVDYLSEKEPVRLLYVGRLDRIKGVDLLIEALLELQTDRQYRLDVVGTGALESEHRSLCEEYGLTDVVTFHGWQEDIEPYYERADIFVLPSRSEGQPTVVLEAQAAGVPVVSTDVGCVDELIGAGAIVTVRTPEQFAACVRTLLEEKYETLQHSARNHVLNGYSRRVTFRRYATLIETVRDR